MTLGQTQHKEIKGPPLQKALSGTVCITGAQTLQATLHVSGNGALS